MIAGGRELSKEGGRPLTLPQAQTKQRKSPAPERSYGVTLVLAWALPPAALRPGAGANRIPGSTYTRPWALYRSNRKISFDFKVGSRESILLGISEIAE